MKYIGQILGSIIVTIIYVFITLLAFSVIYTYFLDQSWSVKLAFIFIGAGFAQGLLALIQTFCTVALVYLLHCNKVALSLSIIYLIWCYGRFIFNIWMIGFEDAWQFIWLLFITAETINFALVSISVMLVAYSPEKKS